MDVLLHFTHAVFLPAEQVRSGVLYLEGRMIMSSNSKLDAKQLLDEARQVIDGEMDCNTAEYRAADFLHRALTEMRIALSALILALEFQQQTKDLFNRKEVSHLGTDPPQK